MTYKYFKPKISGLFLNKTLLRETSTYLIANILYASIPFILLPILTRYLSKDEYGEVSMYYTLVSFLAAFIGVNAHSFSSRKYFEEENEENLSIWNTSSMVMLVLSSLVVLIVLFLFEKQVSDIFGLKPRYVYMAFISSFFLFITNFKLVQWQVRKKSYKYGVFQISQAFFNFLITIILIILLQMKEEGRIYAYFFTSVLFGSLSFYLMYKDGFFVLKLPKFIQLKEIWMFGGPLIFHVGGTFFLAAADRVIIKTTMSLSDVGLYMVAVQFSLVLSVIFSALNKAYVPWLFESLSKESEALKIKLVKFTYMHFVILMLIIIIGIIVGPILIKLIVGVEFLKSAEIIGYLIFGQCFVGAYLMVTNYLFFAKKTGVLAIITIGTGLLNLVLVYILTLEYGLKGAAISFAISMFIRYIITFIAANKFYPMPWIKGLILLKR